MSLQVGVDEAGAGCLFGPVSAAAVILGDNFPHDTYSLLADSKKLSAKKREHMCTQILKYAKQATYAFIPPEKIDQINILEARFLAMHQALDKISRDTYDEILVDGNQFREYHGVKYKTIVKGDAKEKCISAASIVAKVMRDKYILQLVEKYPDLDTYYQMKKNKGYPTKAHKSGIEVHGITSYHRLSYAPCKNRNKNTLC